MKQQWRILAHRYDGSRDLTYGVLLVRVSCTERAKDARLSKGQEYVLWDNPSLWYASNTPNPWSVATQPRSSILSTNKYDPTIDMKPFHSLPVRINHWNETKTVLTVRTAWVIISTHTHSVWKPSDIWHEFSSKCEFFSIGITGHVNSVPGMQFFSSSYIYTITEEWQWSSCTPI